MLAKVIPRKKNDDVASRLQTTVAYIGEGRKHEHKPSVYWHGVLSPRTAVDEMIALATLKPGDPVYHFILTWPEGEQPTDEQMIEAAQIAIAVLVDEHNCLISPQRYEKPLTVENLQYVVAIHRNTANVHTHIVLNRREAQTRTLLKIKRDYLILDKACRRIELKQGWQHTPGAWRVDSRDPNQIVRTRKSSSSQRPRSPPPQLSPIHEYRGVSSFTAFIQQVAPPLINAATSWQHLHEQLATRDVTLQHHSHGLVISDGQHQAKLSLCGTAYSLANLVERWGLFTQPIHVSCQDNNKLIDRKQERALLRDKLWEQYCNYRRSVFTPWQNHKQHDWQQQKAHEKMRKTEFYQAKRTVHNALNVHRWRGKGAVLKALRALAAQQNAEKKVHLQQQITDERLAFKQKYCEQPFQSWREFCETRAAQGDVAAQRTLRGFRYRDRHKAQSTTQLLAGDTDTPVTAIKPSVNFKNFFNLVHSDGQVDYFNYANPSLAFSDHGYSLHIFHNHDEQTLETALRIALEKWGRVKLKGDEEFQNIMYYIAKRLRAEHKVIVTTTITRQLPKLNLFHPVNSLQ